jgi:hypothetical protein
MGKVLIFDDERHCDAWEAYNCKHCAKATNPAEGKEFGCTIQPELWGCAMGTGVYEVLPETAKAMGFADYWGGYTVWDCPERQAR